MAQKWIGLIARGTYHGPEDKLAYEALKVLFQEDLKDFMVVCNEVMSASGEYYVFIKCDNYQEHKEDLAKCSVFVGAVPSYGMPHQFTHDEVGKFAGSVSKGQPKASLSEGDMVCVKTGYLKGLYGVIIGLTPKGKCKVAFRFFMRKFAEILPMASLDFVANVLKGEAFVQSHIPVRGRKREAHLGNVDQIHRSGSRTTERVRVRK